MTAAVMRRITRSDPARIAVYVALIALALLFIAPFLWMVSTSLKTGPTSISVPPIWVPDPVVWNNFPDALAKINFWVALKNTLIYALPSVLGTVVSCSVVAYGFARLKWPGRDLVFIVLLGTMMLPSQVTFIPLYVIYAKLGWVGTFLPLIVPTFLGIPRELSDAARIDGASELRILRTIVVPLSIPALITVGLFTFIDKWTDFFGPRVYLNDPDQYPLSIAIQTFQASHKTDWPLSMAASTVITLPLVIIYFFAQRKFIQGITLTGIKG
jgi:multiple sugar transport system permease protein